MEILKHFVRLLALGTLLIAVSACQKIQVDYALVEEPEDAPEYTVEAQQFPAVKTQ